MVIAAAASYRLILRHPNAFTPCVRLGNLGALVQLHLAYRCAGYCCVTVTFRPLSALGNFSPIPPFLPVREYQLSHKQLKLQVFFWHCDCTLVFRRRNESHEKNYPKIVRGAFDECAESSSHFGDSDRDGAAPKREYF